MSRSLYYDYYPKECDNKKVIPYLAYTDDRWESGLSQGFYKTLREYAEEDTEHDYFIFRDREKLFEFASRPEVPVDMSDYITNPYDYDVGEDDVFIIFVR